MSGVSCVIVCLNVTTRFHTISVVQKYWHPAWKHLRKLMDFFFYYLTDIFYIIFKHTPCFKSIGILAFCEAPRLLEADLLQHILMMFNSKSLIMIFVHESNSWSFFKLITFFISTFYVHFMYSHVQDFLYILYLKYSVPIIFTDIICLTVQWFHHILECVIWIDASYNGNICPVRVPILLELCGM